MKEMIYKKSILFFAILLTFLHLNNCQNESINCQYHHDEDYGYTCNLAIRNANGIDNFTHIGGIHLDGYSDDSVQRIYANANRSITFNVPSIICDKFCNTKTILLREIGIQLLNENAFRGCGNLTELELQHNLIENITGLPYFNLKSLEILHLNNNNITYLAPNVFKNLSKLKVLNLSVNKITRLMAEWFESLESLKLLQLQANSIVEIPRRAFVPLRRLERLEINNNRIRVIHSDSFGVLLYFKTLVIYSNLVEAIDEKFIDNTDITYIDIRSNTCVNGNITDTTGSRTAMRNAMRACLNNYLNLINVCRHDKTWLHNDDYCETENGYQSICELKDDLLTEIQIGNQNILNTMDVMQDDIKELHKLVLELTTRPCSCNP